VWQMKVKDDMKWANGEPLTAEDFAYSLQMLFDPKLVNRRATVLEESNIYIKNAEAYFAGDASVTWEDVGVKVVENNTLEITLEKPVSVGEVKYCFTGSTTIPVYKALYDGGMNADKTETNYGTSAERFMSSGPFMLTSWTTGTEYSCVRNPYYPLQDYISLAGVSFTVVPDSGTAVQLFETGALDTTSLSQGDLEKYGDDPRIIAVKTAAAYCIGINCISTDNPILGNVKFRQALYYGANRDEVAKIANADPVTYFITEEYISDIDNGIAFRDTPEAQAYLPENNGYDPEKAKALMDEALNETGLTKATIQLLYQDGGGARKAVSEYLQHAYAQLFGEDKFEMTLQAVPASQLSEQLRDHVNNPNAFEAGWIASKYNLLDPSSALMEWSADANRKKISYYSDEFTAVYKEITNLPVDDLQGRIEKTAEAEAILLRDAPMIPLFQDMSYTIVSDRVILPFNTYNSVLEMGWIFASIVE
ncbi:MAG: ABC transporter substrate-binding protein, partial [Aristaeellaceae bacterium]